MSYIITDECVCCGICIEKCPISAIVEGENQYFIKADCIQCGGCLQTCPVGAIVKK